MDDDYDVDVDWGWKGNDQMMMGRKPNEEGRVNDGNALL